MISFNYIYPFLFSLIFIGSFGVASTNETFDAKEVIEQYGSDFSDKNLKSLRTIYKQHLIEANYPVPTIARDASYGDHPLQKLDIHLPNNPSSKKLPVVVFVHGGAFVRGDKSDHEIFDNVLNYFTRNDVIGININYRLAPKHKWPSGPEDISAVIEWIHHNEEKYDIDKNKILEMRLGWSCSRDPPPRMRYNIIMAMMVSVVRFFCQVYILRVVTRQRRFIMVMEKIICQLIIWTEDSYHYLLLMLSTIEC